MKKTLAAVLAAAMALSTASVAFAADHPVDAPSLPGLETEDAKIDVEYGEEYKAIIDNLANFTAAQLGQLVDDGIISVSAIMTEGSSKLTARPSISIVDLEDDEVQVDSAVRYVWANDYTLNDRTELVKDGDAFTAIPVVFENNSWRVFEADDTADKIEWLESTHEDFTTLRTELLRKGRIEAVHDLTTDTVDAGKALQLKFEVAHTYGTGSTEVKMKFRITVRKDDETIGLEKGDTYTSDEVTFKAQYGELTSYSEDMELTLTEVDDNNVKLDASDLYDEIGAEDFVIYFDDTAAFSAKLSSAQKDVNLYYTVDEISAVTDAYPDVDFEFIEFKGAPSFLNSGSMTFNAIGAKNTTVYTFDGETLTPLDTTFDSTYGTVTAKGIKKLTTFVVADQVLEVEEEEEEPTEEVTETPEVDESNPNTGAC